MLPKDEFFVMTHFACPKMNIIGKFLFNFDNWGTIMIGEASVSILEPMIILKFTIFKFDLRIHKVVQN